MADRVIQRNDTAARWQSINPILATGEIGIEIDGAKGYKIGDGKTAWNDLPYPANPTNVVQETGDSETVVMSQKATTEKLTELGQEVSYGWVTYKAEVNRYLKELYLHGLAENTDYDVASIYNTGEQVYISIRDKSINSIVASGISVDTQSSVLKITASVGYDIYGYCAVDWNNAPKSGTTFALIRKEKVNHLKSNPLIYGYIKDVEMSEDIDLIDKDLKRLERGFVGEYLDLGDKGLIRNGTISNENVWVSDGKHLCVSVIKGAAITLEKNDTLLIYALIKSDNTDSSVEYVGVQRTVSSKTETIYVDEDSFLYVSVIGSNGVTYMPSSIYIDGLRRCVYSNKEEIHAIKENVQAIEDKIMDMDRQFYTTEIDLSNKKEGYINSSKTWVNEGTHISFSVKKGQSVEIDSPSELPCVYALISSEIGVNPVSFIIERTTVGANKTVGVDITSDGYFYLTAKLDNGYDYTPRSVKLNGVVVVLGEKASKTADDLSKKVFENTDVVVIGDSSQTTDKWCSYFQAMKDEGVNLNYINNAYGSSSFLYSDYYVPETGTGNNDSSKYLLLQWNNIKSKLTTDNPIVIVCCGGNALSRNNELIDGYETSFAKCFDDTSNVDFLNTDGNQKELEGAIETYKTIVREFPKVRLYIINNWYAKLDSAERGAKRNLLRMFNQAMCDFFGATMIDITKNAMIHPYTEMLKVDDSFPYRKATDDGIHITKEPYKRSVFAQIVGEIVKSNFYLHQL